MIDEQRDGFAAMGLEVRPFGPCAYIIEAVPPEVGTQDVAAYFCDLVAEFAENATCEKEGRRRLALAVASSAVRRNRPLQEAAASRLVGELLQTSQWDLCPYGKPTFVRIGTGDIEKRMR